MAVLFAPLGGESWSRKLNSDLFFSSGVASKGADVWPKMRSMKTQDLVDMSSYILYQNYTIPEKWGGGKQYY